MKTKFHILIVLMILLSASPSYAQLVVDESRIETVVPAGESLVNRLVLRNMGDTTKDVKIYWQDFDYVDPFNGDKKFIPPGGSKFSMAEWITVTPNTVRIPAKGYVDVSYAIKMPSSAEGGYYGVMFFEEVDSTKVSSTGIKIVMRIGSLFFISTSENRDTAQISNIQTDDGTLSGDLLNDGQTILFPEGTYYVMDQEGLVADRGEIEKLFLPAGETGSFNWNLDRNLSIGNYSVILTFDLGHGYSVVKEIDIEKKYDDQLVIKRIRD